MSPNVAAALLKIGQHIRAARTEGVKCSEADFARKIGCSVEELRLLETGAPTTPTGVLMSALHALQVLPAVVDAANPSSFILASQPVSWPDDTMKT